MHPQPHPINPDSRWKGLYLAGGVACIAMLAIMAVQIVVFILWPPPQTVEGFFTLFQENWLLGLVSMDLLYIFNNTLLILIYLALYTAVRREAESASLIALVLGLLGIGAYYASNTAFEMLSLSGQYAAAGTDAQRMVFMAAGQGMLETYKGTAFDTYYILNGIALLIFSVIMLRGKIFSRTTAVIGLVSGILMSIPSTAGVIGLIFSLASLVPWAVFAALMARKFFKFSKETPV